MGTTDTPATNSTPHYRHLEHPKTVAPDDFWGQVSRTIHGKPVDEGQIQLILQAIRNGLQLAPNDHLLDLACGNGALAARLHAGIQGCEGVDFSDYLIQVARQHFSKPLCAGGAAPTYVCQDAASYAAQAEQPDRFTKALCYGAFPYFSHDDVRNVLGRLSTRFTGIRRVYLGNLPDRALAHRFFQNAYTEETLDDPLAPIGIWRTQEQLETLAACHGWRTEIVRMPVEFYAAHYRYDAILTRLS